MANIKNRNKTITKPKTTTTKETTTTKHQITKFPAELQPHEAYKKYLPLAQTFSGQIHGCRADLPVVRKNIEAGLLSVEPYLARIYKELPAISVDHLGELRQLAIAAEFAAEQIVEATGKDHDLHKKLSRLHELRAVMLSQLEILALLKLVPEDKVKGIRSGHGPYDAARDGVQIETMFNEYRKSIEHKHPFTEQDIKEIGELGTWLSAKIKPTGTRGTQIQSLPEESTEEIRDRFWSLIQEYHRELRKVGFHLFEETVNEHVPLLQSRTVTRKPAEESKKI